MAIKPTPLGTQITLVGQSDSGKTNMLAALLGNTNAHADLQTGPGRITDVSWSAATDDSSDDKQVEQLMGYADNILRGRVLTNEGSNEVRIYPCTLDYREIVKVTKRQGLFNGSVVYDKPSDPKRINFKIIDGRGGDIAPENYLDPDNPQDERPIARQREYRDRLNESVGAIVIMPIDKKGFQRDLANRLVRELMRTIDERKKASDLPKLKHVALCYTKYDDLFTHLGAGAGEKAASWDAVVKHLADSAMVKVFQPLFSLAQNDPEFKICIFPVSTFGFVHGTGAANFYNLEESPGLLTRTIKRDDWNNPETPDLINHFPFEMTENQAQSLWRPFNIAPPIYFALTGKITGPLYLHPEEILSEEDV